MSTMRFPRSMISFLFGLGLVLGAVSIATPAQAADSWQLEGTTVASNDNASNPKAIMKVYHKEGTHLLKTRIFQMKASWKYNPPTVRYYKRVDGPVRKICGQGCKWLAKRQVWSVVSGYIDAKRPGGRWKTYNFGPIEVYSDNG